MRLTWQPGTGQSSIVRFNGGSSGGGHRPQGGTATPAVRKVSLAGCQPGGIDSSPLQTGLLPTAGASPLGRPEVAPLLRTAVQLPAMGLGAASTEAQWSNAATQQGGSEGSKLAHRATCLLLVWLCKLRRRVMRRSAACRIGLHGQLQLRNILFDRESLLDTTWADARLPGIPDSI